MGPKILSLTTSDVDVKDTAEPIKMDIVRTGTYTIDNEGRGMQPGYDVIGVGTGEQPSFPAD